MFVENFFFDPDLPPPASSWQVEEMDLDASWAHRWFFGKNANEVVSMFEEDVLEASSCINSMPPLAFVYYIAALGRYVSEMLANRADNFSAAVDCLFGVYAENLERRPLDVRGVYSYLLPIFEQIARNQEVYDLSRDIYGSYSERLDRIRSLIASA